MGACCNSDIRYDHQSDCLQKSSFLAVFENRPDFLPYKNNLEWKSSIFQPLNIDGRTILNNLKNIIDGTETLYLYGGGFYQIPA